MMRNALIVEDEAVLARNIQNFFERSGYSVRTADTAEDGLRMIEKARPDVVLLDYQLPGMDGIEMLNRLHDIDPSLRVVMLSGAANVDVALSAMRLGAADFITKPISLCKLRYLVDRIFVTDATPETVSGPVGQEPDAGDDAARPASRLMNRLRDDFRRLLDS